MRRSSCVLLTCEDGLGDAAIAFAGQLFDLRLVARYPDPTAKGVPDELGELVRSEKIDYIFSFLSPVIVPKSILGCVRLPINFHTAPPRWPGIGGPCFALYYGDTRYGVTAHVMEQRVDTGDILRVDSFDILDTDTQSSLLERTRYRALSVYYDVLAELAKTGTISPSGHRWEREPLSRKSVDELLTLSITDSAEKVALSIRAGRNPHFPAPVLSWHGYRFAYLDADDS
ncbi:hypothetical protein Ari01nite_26920 [Paractinoplanes rishiriensis]|uniref:Formyl transferase N-terminal domain-containing protein n=1 Tax=Paractinoplanes rishiriensis TaxID=1050105 RepID=A0A919N0K8_9ACTN|nr:hypothetical protein Ari01nite_26920 [Actinoplanes rishiriensis]